MERPFVYISALMRTGSTVLSEALTSMPRTYIFHETHLGKNTFSLSKPDQERLNVYGVDIEAFLHRPRIIAFILRRLRTVLPSQDYMIRMFKYEFMPSLCAVGLKQVGVKEIKHEGWENYIRHFPSLKMIMLGRDPRDIYLSAYRKWRLGTTLWHGHFTPVTVARELNAQFSHQRAMHASVDSMQLRYEDLCRDSREIRRVMHFTESPIQNIGEIGRFLRSHPKRRHEHALHGNRISQRSVCRWKRETDENLLADAYEFAARLPEYNAFWGYEC